MACVAPLLGPPAAVSCLAQNSTDALVSQTNDLNLAGKPPMGLTENSSPTFLSTGNPCLDFFFHVVPDTPPEEVVYRLESAWVHDPLTTLKLICNLRGVRGTGKSDKENFYTAALWLYQKHPKTLALNARIVGVDFGYLKDLPEILYRILEGPDKRKLEREEWRGRKRGKRRQTETEDSDEKSQNAGENVENVKKTKKGAAIDMEKEKEKARALRKERVIVKARKALEKYSSDSSYRFLFDCVCDAFADLLKADMSYLNSNELSKISLAAKWCPSIDSSYDRAILLCEGIAKRVFPKECDKDYENLEEAHYVYRVRDRLRKQVLVPLHKVLRLPEVYMSAREWNSLPYNRVASVAMKNYKGLFTKHDKERFDKYLEDVKSGKAKIAAGALLPHEIIKSLSDESGEKVGELQWSRLVEDVSKKGKLKNCLAICDVSGSMSGIPMDVSVALGLLVSELSEEPWKGKVITFSDNPELHLIEGDTLKSKTEFVMNMDWGCNTDLLKVFDRILEVAAEDNVSEDQMIKRLFIFSDMEFDDARPHQYYMTDSEEVKDGREEWKTDYELIQKKFKDKGYNYVPEIVFWNLRSSHSTPVLGKESGVALVSGFSKNLLTLFLEEGGIVNPEQVMGMAIDGEEYKKLVVHD